MACILNAVLTSSFYGPHFHFIEKDRVFPLAEQSPGREFSPAEASWFLRIQDKAAEHLSGSLGQTIRQEDFLNGRSEGGIEGLARKPELIVCFVAFYGKSSLPHLVLPYHNMLSYLYVDYTSAIYYLHSINKRYY